MGELQAEDRGVQWAPITIVDDEQRKRCNWDLGRARYASTRELMTEYLNTNESRPYAARTRAATSFWLCWLTVLSILGDNGVSPCSFPETADRLLPTGRRAAAQTRHGDFDLSDEKSPGQFFIFTGEVSVHLSATPYSHL